MAINERTRHELYLKLEQALGPTEATTLMEHLPPVGWADVATKHDLKQEIGHLREYVDLRFEVCENKLIAMFRGELNAQTRTFMLTMSGLMVTIAGLAFTAARLI